MDIILIFLNINKNMKIIIYQNVNVVKIVSIKQV